MSSAGESPSTGARTKGGESPSTGARTKAGESPSTGARTKAGESPSTGTRTKARERILAAAVRQIARHGIDEVRIARIAVEAGFSPALVHYHFATRDALLAEAIDYSYAHAGQVRLEAGELPAASRRERLQSMIDQCLPTTDELRADWVLWIELWLRAVRHPQLAPVAEELYARLHRWFADEIAAGIGSGEFARCDPDEVADRVLALLDGYGVRALIGDSQLPLARARREVAMSLARDLGLGERLVSGELGERLAAATPTSNLTSTSR